MNRLLFLLSFVLYLAGCSQPESPRSDSFSKISIESHPLGEGFANKSVTADGNVEGAHLSGGPNVFVHQSESNLSPTELQSLQNLALNIPYSQHKDVSAPDQKKFGYKTVIIQLPGISYSYFAEWDDDFSPQEVQQIWAIVKKQSAGAW
jgi:hypothetical protein